jgi:hypothetical protein
LQIYTADLTQLFTWTCARCGGLIKVSLRYPLISVLSSAIPVHVSLAVWGLMMKSYWMTQGFEMIDIVVDVENCLEVRPYLLYSDLCLPVL